MANRLRRFAVACNRLGILVAELGLLALMLLTGYAVIARYVFKSPSVHAIELSVYLLLVIAWVSIGWVHREDRHVSMEALNTRLTPRLKRASNIVSQVTVLLFCAVLVGAGAYGAWTSYLRDYRSTSLLEFPLWIPYALIPIGGVLLALMALARLGERGDAGGAAEIGGRRTDGPTDGR
jgi:TRAP-type C4-dicarboxylate transport system permease small subunit